ncbi:amidohydrolase [Deltaproteobacteria bacterium]|nr:amidohydrolase [Deltaproteobacteria bacterium]
MIMPATINPNIAALHEDMRAWRHHLHAMPEIAFEETETAAYIAGLLQSFGIEEVHTHIAKTGVVAVIRGKQPGPWVGLRADIDALRVTETNDLPYRSKNPGKMHACGHDGHTAMLLGAGKYLADTRDFAGTAALIFQPAEENEGGGRVMVEEGLFTRFPIESVYGLHNDPDLPAGNFSIKTGPIMAAYDVFTITLKGFGAHAAKPHLGRDVLVAAGQLIGALQTIVSRSLNPMESAVVSVTQMNGGDTWNVLPQEATLRGTARTFLPSVQDMVEQRMGEIIQGIAAMFGMQGELRYERRYPALVNDEAPTRIAVAAASALVGEERIDLHPQSVMGSEDFAFLQKVKPGAYIRLGMGSGGVPHNPGYVFNDDILPVGAAYWVEVVKNVCK